MMKPQTITFGEIMLRLTPPGFERYLQTPNFNATFGGGEANVSVALATLGLNAAYVTVLPENNPIADACVAELRRFGVDTSKIVRGKGRMNWRRTDPFGLRRIKVDPSTTIEGLKRTLFRERYFRI